MSVMPRTHAGSKSKPGYSRGFMRRLLLPSLAACSLVSLFALPKVAAQVSRRTVQGNYAPPGSLPVIGTPDGPGTGGSPLPAGLHITTERFNNRRDGFNNQETTLTPANIGASTFGRVGTRTVDGLIYGQPLYIQNLPVSNSIGQVTTHNVVFIATNNNSIYAFDADNFTGSNSGPLWHVNFNVPGINGGPTNGNDVTTAFGLPQSEIQPLIGITGTPVIDETTGTLYVVARTTEGNDFVHRLHSIDIRTGAERINSPALVGQYQDPLLGIQPLSVPGNGDDPDGNGNVIFDLLNQNQRPALSLVNGVIYIAYGAFDHSPPYHGWVFGYNTANIQAKPSIFCTSPNASAGGGFFSLPTEGGIDMSGAGPASDGASLFFSTGAGIFNANTINRRTGLPGTEYGESVLKIGLAPAGTGILPVQDYFTPFNNDILTQFSDLGTGGVSLLPANAIPNDPLTGAARPAMITAGMEGKIYILNRSALGNIQNLDAGAISTIPNGNAAFPLYPLLGANYSTPTIFTDLTGSTPRYTVFFHASGDAVRGFNMIATYPYLDTINVLAGSSDPNPTPRPNPPLIRFDFPGAQTVISSKPNGSDAVLWEVESAPVPNTDPNQGNTTQTHNAVLHAYNVSQLPAVAPATTATGPLTELFNSNQKGGGINSIGTYADFTYSQPLVAGGKVFVTAAAPTPPALAGTGAAPQGRLVVFGPISPQQGAAGQGTHYQLSGPVGWPFVGIGVVEASRAYQYSLTAVDANNRPQAITTNLTLSLMDVFTGRKTSAGSVTFNNQSYVTFTKTLNIQGTYYIQAQDSNGNMSQANLPIAVVGTLITGFDRFNLRMPTTVRSGQVTNVTLTPVDFRGFPVQFNTFVSIIDTVPNGTQDTVFGATNFAYELQYGFPGIDIEAGAVIGITGVYPNINGTGTYPCIFRGAGQHVVVVQDLLTGQMTTGIINVVP